MHRCVGVPQEMSSFVIDAKVRTTVAVTVMSVSH